MLRNSIVLLLAGAFTIGIAAGLADADLAPRPVHKSQRHELEIKGPDNIVAPSPDPELDANWDTPYQLDSNTSREIMDYLLKINKEEQVTLIVVTHEDLIAAAAKRPMTIIDGKLYEGILESFLNIKAIEKGLL